MGTNQNLWNRDPGSVRVTSFPPSQAAPRGIPEIYVPLVSYPHLSGANGFSTTDWVTVGLTAAALVGLGVLLAHSA
jgi:hypothetical protein